ncbi:hypothetical protein HN51_036237, partial [Arachis hypogaea]
DDSTQGANDVEAGLYDEHSNNEDSEDNGRVQQEDSRGLETEATCEPLVPVAQERNGVRDNEKRVEDRMIANDNEASDNESSR